MPLDLTADQPRQGLPDLPIELADGHLRLRGQVILRPLDQSLARPQDDSLDHRNPPDWSRAGSLGQSDDYRRKTGNPKDSGHQSRRIAKSSRRSVSYRLTTR